MSAEDLRVNLSKYGQQHLLQYWDSLTDVQRNELSGDINEINLDSVVANFQKVTALKSDQKLDDKMQPVPSTLFGGVKKSTDEDLKSYEDEGFDLISKGKVAVLVLAGGMGTRLGVTYPKGMYDVGLPSKKPLFQLQAERIRKLINLVCKKTNKKSTITWFIMTSESTMDKTMDFFNKHNFFGLNRQNVLMFEQYMLPAFTFEGKIILEEKHKVAKSPDGNGGLYRALRDRKILDEMERRGIEYVHAYSVDNILVKVADPLFVGYCSKQGSDCGVKVVEKKIPTEEIGVVCMVDDKWQVVEYSEITSKAAEKRSSDGSLTYNAGNICNHLFATSFLRKIADNHEAELPTHVARKKIKYVDLQTGASVKPTEPNGIKMEKFIFDVFPFANKLVVWEVEREDEFSALKNAEEVGKDCPSTSRRSLYQLHHRWVQKAGGDVVAVTGEVVCEISPLISYAGEGLEERVDGKKFKSPFVLACT